MRLPTGPTQQPSDNRQLERIQFLAVAVRTEPVIRRRALGQGTSRSKHIPMALTIGDTQIARDSASETQEAPSKT
ncbi:MAG: hypothetical protein ACYC7F_03255, partial [Gemmatimonadaceae bacterium]